MKLNSTIINEWRALPEPKPKKRDGEPEPSILRMRGSKRAGILLIAPPCDAEEYENQLPLSNDNAQNFHILFKKNCGLDTNTDCLVVSCSRWGIKPSKASTQDVRNFIMSLAPLSQFSRFICIGDDAFKYIFGRGKKPSMNALAGNMMYVPETAFKPLFVFPSLDGLSVDTDGLTRREWGRVTDWSDKVVKRFVSLMERYKYLIENGPRRS